MKYWPLFLLLPLSLGAQQWNQDLFRLQNSPPPLYPFSVGSTYLTVAPAHFRTKGFSRQKLKYRQWEAALAYTHPFTECSGLLFGAGWVGSEVDFENNPNFHEKNFNYVNFSFGGYTTFFPDWTWSMTLASYLDTGNFSITDHALYQGNLWGRYEISDTLQLDFGVLVEVGLRKERVWPIVGFIYIPYERWRLSAIYPIDISLQYDFNQMFSLAASIRFLRNRHRVGENEPNPQAIFEYRTAGVECDLIFMPWLWIYLTGFVGSTVNGDFEVSNRSHHQSIHYKFKGSFYAGATAIVSF